MKRSWRSFVGLAVGGVSRGWGGQGGGGSVGGGRRRGVRLEVKNSFLHDPKPPHLASPTGDGKFLLKRPQTPLFGVADRRRQIPFTYRRAWQGSSTFTLWS